MMPSKVEAGEKTSEGSDGQNKLLKDIDTIGKALNLDKNYSRNSKSTAKSRSKSTKKATFSDPKSKPEASKDDNSRKEKKSIWKWKPLKALSLSRNRKFNCCFSLQVHLIEGLPPSFDDASLCVYWKRKDDILVTPPAKVIQGAAEFEQVLTYTCSIYGSKSGPQNSAKYEAKQSFLYASVVGTPELDLGKQRVDLTRLLPITLEELLEEKSSGKWTTSFRLSGAARGAAMNVSFGYVVVGDKAIANGDNHSAPNVLSLRQNSSASLRLDREPSQSDMGLMRTGSLPSFTSEYSSQNVDDVKDLHEVFPLSKSASLGDILKFDEEKTCSPLQNKPELEVFKENLKPIKPDVYSSSDIGKDKPEEHPGNKGKTSPLVRGKPEFDVFKENLELIKPDVYSSSDVGKDKPQKHPSNKGKTSPPVLGKPGFDVSKENLEPIKPDVYSSSDIGKDKPEEHPGNKGKTSPLVRGKPEFDMFKDKLEPIKPVIYSSSDIGKDKPEEHPGNKGKTSRPAHGKPEFDAVQEKLETVKPDGYPLPNSGQENPEESEDNGFSVVDKGIEFSSNEHVKLEESTIKALVNDHTFNSTCTLDTAGIQVSFQDSVKHDTQDEVNDGYKEKAVVHEFSYEEDELCMKELLLQEIESALSSVKDLAAVAQESPNIMEAKSEYKMRKSHSLYDVTDSVASEFLSMLGIDHSPMGLSPESELESPRERLLRQFEMDAGSEGFSLFDFDMGSDNEADGSYETSCGSEPWNFSKGIKSSSFLNDLHEVHLIQFQETRSKQKAQMPEDLETEALMRAWGLNEKAFQHSPARDSAGFRSPIHVLPEEPLILPPLAEGLGPFLQTKNGGFLRSMNPSLFRNTKSDGRLIMQISNPVVVPAEMGSGIMDILQCLASMGIEKLSMQANKLMPVEDITGKTMQQIAWEAMPVQGKERQCHLQHNLETRQDTDCVLRGSKGTSSGLKPNMFGSSSVGNHTGSEFVSLEALAPLAMDKIEALSMEGLRIQCGMEDEDAPSNVIAQSFGDISALHGKGTNVSGSLGLNGAAALQLLDIKDSNVCVDGIMGLSLTLDEWMRLDSGEIDDIDNISEHTSKLLAAHHANSFDLTRGSSKGERKRGKDQGRRRGLLGNNFTAALMVQLRDPLRNYEPVGTPMLALILVERVFVPPKQKLYRCVSEVGNISDEDDDCEIVAKVEMKDNKIEENKPSEEEGIPQFRINEVHVAGFKTEPHKKQHWGLWDTSRHQQSGSRWLLANGMGKTKKNPLLKSKAISKSSAPITTKVQPGDTLWSISSRIYGTGDKWMELAALNSHIRNPNIIIPNETIRIR